MNTGFVRTAVATVLTVYGIETPLLSNIRILSAYVATVLTVYGIETILSSFDILHFLSPLQQYLPFTVLKLSIFILGGNKNGKLQQYLPFTVLKLKSTFRILPSKSNCCNSTYRLRY